tara:strand:+ start:109 stop:396 length:288 start_codon:yes stop_codon:yes gene_type:complete
MFNISESLIGKAGINNNKETKMQEQAKNHMVSYLIKKAESDKEKALGSLSLLLDSGVGIGDHSTEDYYKNLDEALDILVDAKDRLDVLHEYFSEK